MARISVINNLLYLISRRTYASSATESMVKSPSDIASALRKKASRSSSKIVENHKDVFWMRDPKTGNWIPENHFGDVDVAELRKEVLLKKRA